MNGRRPSAVSLAAPAALLGDISIEGGALARRLDGE